MGAHLYRRTRHRHTATYAYAKTAFETDISSQRQQLNTRVTCACGACPVKWHQQSTRRVAVVGLLQNRRVRRRLEQWRVGASRECSVGGEERRRTADMATAGARDAARAGSDLVGWTRRGDRGKSVGDQPGGGHSMASSVSTQHALQDLRDHDLTTGETVSVCK